MKISNKQILNAFMGRKYLFFVDLAGNLASSGEGIESAVELYEGEGPLSQAIRAVVWIEALRLMKKGKKTRIGVFGDKDNGFCALGAGAYVVLGANGYSPHASLSMRLIYMVGLRSPCGSFKDGEKPFCGKTSITGISDNTNAGFKRISKLMSSRPHAMFDYPVADLIRYFYSGEETPKIKRYKEMFLCGH